MNWFTRRKLKKYVRNIKLIGALADLKKIDSEDFIRHVLIRAAGILSIEQFHELQPNYEFESPEADKARKRIEKAIYEKVNKEANFQPIELIYSLAEIAKAVVRIQIGTGGYGTGFLISVNGKPAIMTNYHVIQTASQLVGTKIAFNYEASNTAVIVEPTQGLFYSCMELDFGIFGICSVPEGIKPIKLLQEQITRGELVYIIQHPMAEFKKICIHDNTCQYVFTTAIRYITDTQPGSSGSPCVNSAGRVIALHHAGWQFSDNVALNEGVLMSEILKKLNANGYFVS